MNNFTYICQREFNTMDTQRAYLHAREHQVNEIKQALSVELACMTGNLQGRMIYICPNGYNSNAYHPYNSHHRAFYVTSSELDQMEGVCGCEHCDCECIRLV